MKIRTDFVTNSSSSSFIAYTLKDTKKNREEAKEIFEFEFDAFEFIEELIKKYKINPVSAQYDLNKEKNKIYVCCESQLYNEYRYPDDEDYLDYEPFMGDYWARFGEAIMSVIEGWDLNDLIEYKTNCNEPKRLSPDEVKKLKILDEGDFGEFADQKFFIGDTD